MIDMFYENADYPGVPRGTCDPSSPLMDTISEFALDARASFNDLSPAAGTLGVPEGWSWIMNVQSDVAAREAHDGAADLAIRARGLVKVLRRSPGRRRHRPRRAARHDLRDPRAERRRQDDA